MTTAPRKRTAPKAETPDVAPEVTDATEQTQVTEQTPPAEPDAATEAPAAAQRAEVTSAPLEPPVETAPQGKPEGVGYITPVAAGVLLAEQAPDALIVDAATGKPPTDLDALFTPLTNYGTAMRCEVRLVQRTVVSRRRTDEQVVMPQDAIVSVNEAARIVEFIREQQATTAAKARVAALLADEQAKAAAQA